MDSGQPMITNDLWQKVIKLPFESLEGWGKQFSRAASDGNESEMLMLLERLELSARLHANPVLFPPRSEQVAGDVSPVGAVDKQSFVVEMRAEHGPTILRNHMPDHMRGNSSTDC